MGLKEQLAGFMTDDEMENILSQGYINFEDEENGIDVESELKDFGVDLEELEKSFSEYTPKLELGYNKLSADAVDPKYNYPSDSGFDLHSTKDMEIEPFGRVLVPTGLSLDISDGYEIQVRSKSGLAIKQGLMVLNSPGTVDNGYTGEVQVIVFNTNNYNVLIHKGMKVGQAVLCPVVNGKWVDLVNKETINKKERGENGFGSTGI
jgi:dUTP pyrophosphatase